MSAICGTVCAPGSADLDYDCRRMLRAQHSYGPHDAALVTDDGVALGRALYRLLPEDEFDQQPLSGGGGRFRLVADVRIDNREELVSALGGLPGACARFSDAAVLLACYERWGIDLVDRLAGDFAFAIWDADHRRLTMARDPLGQRPLHYRIASDRLDFSSMPSGVLALDSSPPAADGERIAEFLSDLRPSLDRSFFAGVESVCPGHVAVFERGKFVSRRYWNPQPRALGLETWDDHVQAFREQVDQAVRSRLRGSGPVVGAHLSSGYDSSTVAATAARLMRGNGGRVLAITSAPRLGFVGEPARGRIADESGIASITAALHPNIEHLVLRPGGRSPIAATIDEMPYAQQPLGNLKNAAWWSRAAEQAAGRGATVMLTGENGNMSLSAGGLEQLAEMVRRLRWLRWAREAWAVKRSQPVRWTGLLAASYGPWVPHTAWKLITRMAWRDSARQGTPFLLTPEWRERVARRSSQDVWSSRPPSDSRAVRLALLKRQSHGNSRKATLARWGIDERDPTSDRRLIDFCFSLPPEMLLKNGVRRPLARAALADRLPPEVLEGAVRGYQSADWYEQIGKEETAALFRSVEHCPAAAAVIDMGQIRHMIENWPSADWHLPVVFSDYSAMLNALSSAYFISLIAKGGVAPDL